MIAAHVWSGDETARQTIIPNACGNITSVPDGIPFLEAIIGKICCQVFMIGIGHGTKTIQVHIIVIGYGTNSL